MATSTYPVGDLSLFNLDDIYDRTGGSKRDIDPVATSSRVTGGSLSSSSAGGALTLTPKPSESPLPGGSSTESMNAGAKEGGGGMGSSGGRATSFTGAPPLGPIRDSRDSKVSSIAEASIPELRRSGESSTEPVERSIDGSARPKETSSRSSAGSVQDVSRSSKDEWGSRDRLAPARANAVQSSDTTAGIAAPVASAFRHPDQDMNAEPHNIGKQQRAHDPKLQGNAEGCVPLSQYQELERQLAESVRKCGMQEQLLAESEQQLGSLRSSGALLRSQLDAFEERYQSSHQEWREKLRVAEAEKEQAEQQRRELKLALMDAEMKASGIGRPDINTAAARRGALQGAEAPEATLVVESEAQQHKPHEEEVLQLRCQLAELESTVKASEAALNRSSDAHTRLQQQLADSEQQVHELMQQQAQLSQDGASAEELAGLKEELQKMRAQCATLQTSAESGNSAHNSQLWRCEQLSDEKAQLAAQLQALRSKLDSAEQERDRLRTAAQSSAEAVQRAREQRAELQSSLAIAQANAAADAATLRLEISELKMQLSTAPASGAQLAAPQSSSGADDIADTAVSEARRVVQSELAALREQIEVLEGEKSSLLSQLSRQNTELSHAKTELTSLASMADTCRALEAENKRVGEQLQAATQRSAAQAIQAESHLSAAEQLRVEQQQWLLRRGELEAEAARLRSELEQERGTSTQKDKKIRSYQEELLQLQRRLTDNGSSSSPVALGSISPVQALDLAAREIGTGEPEREKERRREREAQAQALELQRLQEQLEKTSEECSRLRAEKAQLQAEKGRLEKTSEECSRLRAEKAQLQAEKGQLEKTSEECSRLRAEKAQLQAEKERNRTELEIARANLAQTQQQLVVAAGNSAGGEERDGGGISAAYAEVCARERQLNAQLASHAQRLQAAQDELAAAQASREVSEGSIHRLQQDVTSYKQKWVDAENRLSKAQQQASKAEDAEFQLGLIGDELSAAQTTLRSSRGELASLRAELEQAHSELQAAQLELESRAKRVQLLEQELASLRRELAATSASSSSGAALHTRADELDKENMTEGIEPRPAVSQPAARAPAAAAPDSLRSSIEGALRLGDRHDLVTSSVDSAQHIVQLSVLVGRQQESMLRMQDQLRAAELRITQVSTAGFPVDGVAVATGGTQPDRAEPTNKIHRSVASEPAAISVPAAAPVADNSCPESLSTLLGMPPESDGLPSDSPPDYAWAGNDAAAAWARTGTGAAAAAKTRRARSREDDAFLFQTAQCPLHTALTSAIKRSDLAETRKSALFPENPLALLAYAQRAAAEAKTRLRREGRLLRDLQSLLSSTKKHIKHDQTCIKNLKVMWRSQGGAGAHTPQRAFSTAAINTATAAVNAEVDLLKAAQELLRARERKLRCCAQLVTRLQRLSQPPGPSAHKAEAAPSSAAATSAEDASQLRPALEELQAALEELAADLQALLISAGAAAAAGLAARSGADSRFGHDGRDRHHSAPHQPSHDGRDRLRYTSHQPSLAEWPPTQSWPSALSDSPSHPPPPALRASAHTPFFVHEDMTAFRPPPDTTRGVHEYHSPQWQHPQSHLQYPQKIPSQVSTASHQGAAAPGKLQELHRNSGRDVRMIKNPDLKNQLLRDQILKISNRQSVSKEVCDSHAGYE